MQVEGSPGGASGKEPACQWRRHKRGWFHPLGRSPGGGHGNSLQSCLEDPVVRGAWWATVHRVAELDMIPVTEHMQMEVGSGRMVPFSLVWCLEPEIPPSPWWLGCTSPSCGWPEFGSTGLIRRLLGLVAYRRLTWLFWPKASFPRSMFSNWEKGTHQRPWCLTWDPRMSDLKPPRGKASPPLCCLQLLVTAPQAQLLTPHTHSLFPRTELTWPRPD